VQSGSGVEKEPGDPLETTVTQLPFDAFLLLRKARTPCCGVARIELN
jgi:hypothetical protein